MRRAALDAEGRLLEKQAFVAERRSWLEENGQLEKRGLDVATTTITESDVSVSDHCNNGSLHEDRPELTEVPSLFSLDFQIQHDDFDLDRCGDDYDYHLRSYYDIDVTND